MKHLLLLTVIFLWISSSGVLKEPTLWTCAETLRHLGATGVQMETTQTNPTCLKNAIRVGFVNKVRWKNTDKIRRERRLRDVKRLKISCDIHDCGSFSLSPPGYAQNCTPTTNAKCSCWKGFLCSNEDCSECVASRCAVGELMQWAGKEDKMSAAHHAERCTELTHTSAYAFMWLRYIMFLWQTLDWPVVKLWLLCVCLFFFSKKSGVKLHSFNVFCVFTSKPHSQQSNIHPKPNQYWTALHVTAVKCRFLDMYFSIAADTMNEDVSTRRFTCEPMCRTHEYFDEKQYDCKPRKQ